MIDLQWITRLAEQVADRDASATGIAAQLGKLVDPTGRGEQLRVLQPDIPGAREASVLAKPPVPEPAVIVVDMDTETAPTLEAVELALGAGQVVGGMTGERRQFVLPAGPPGCTVIVGVDDADRVVEVWFRRDWLVS